MPSEQLKTVMEFEADRMTGLVLTDAVVKPELQVILEERNQRIENNPRARLGEQIDAALFLNSPYGKPVIGWRHEMEGLTRDDAIGFYRRFYGPNDAVVVIAGDIKPEAALKLAEETYGKIKRRTDLPPRHRPQEPPPAAVRSLTLADPRVEQPMLQRAYLVPSFATAKAHKKPGESEALEVLGAYPRHRLQQPALSRTGGRQARRRQRRRLLRQFGARHGEVHRLRRAAAGRFAAASLKRRPTR